MNILSHAEIKDKYLDLEVKLDELGAELRELPFEYKLIDQVRKIDQEIDVINNWYEHMKVKINKYESQKKHVENKIENITKRVRSINNYVQSIKLQASSHALHKDRCLP
jgi:predicted  nucleic acid-binding Zn-ribbon protein